MSQDDPENQTTHKKLKEKTEFDFFEEPLREVLTHIGDMHRIQLRCDVKAIQAVGHDIDTPITIQIKNVPAEVALRFMLQDLDLSYYLDNGIVIVTSKEETQCRLFVRMYNVKDLVGEDALIITKGHDAFPSYLTSNYLTSKPVQPNSDGLIQLIEKVVEPENWVHVGGAGTISYYRGVLVVRQTEAVHEKIEKILDQLRYMLKDSPPPKNTLTIDPNKCYSAPSDMGGIDMSGMGMSTSSNVGGRSRLERTTNPKSHESTKSSKPKPVEPTKKK